MTLQQLAMFAAVARHRNLTRASEELGKSEPTLSRYLKAMQEQHGSQLFRRVSRGVVLTAEGHLFLSRIVPILDQVAELESGGSPALVTVVSQVLRVGGAFSPSAVLLPKLLSRVRQRFPGLELVFSTSTSDRLEGQLSLAQLDVAVSARAPLSADLAFEPLRPEKIALFVLADHPLAKKSSLAVTDLVKAPLVLRGGPGGAGVTDKAINSLRAGGADVRIAMYCNGPISIKAAVRQRMGVGVVLADAIRSEVASGEFKILKVPGLDLVGQSYIVYSNTRPLSPIAQVFLEMLRGERAKIDSKRVPIVPALRLVPKVPMAKSMTRCGSLKPF